MVAHVVIGVTTRQARTGQWQMLAHPLEPQACPLGDATHPALAAHLAQQQKASTPMPLRIVSPAVCVYPSLASALRRVSAHLPLVRWLESQSAPKLCYTPSRTPLLWW